MSDLDRLTRNLDEQSARAVRLGYALGVLHGRDEDRSPDIDVFGPEFRALYDMGLPA